MMQAETDQGRIARTMYKQLRDAVQDYMQIEMAMAASLAAEREKEAHQQLEEANAKRAELEAVQSTLQATIESHRMRDEKKKARKAQQKEPLEKTYILSNSPGGVGPFKLGKTGSDGKKRAKQMQTGNHELMTCVFEISCVNSLLIEKVTQHIFWDYRINDNLEWFDAPKESMVGVLQFLVLSIDGLQSVDHDDVAIARLLSTITDGLRQELDTARQLPTESLQQSDERGLEDLDHESPIPSPNPVFDWMK